jgi:cell division protein FtsW
MAISKRGSDRVPHARKLQPAPHGLVLSGARRDAAVPARRDGVPNAQRGSSFSARRDAAMYRDTTVSTRRDRASTARRESVPAARRDVPTPIRGELSSNGARIPSNRASDKPVQPVVVGKKGLLGQVPVRKLRSMRATKPLRMPTQAVMATRVALEPDGHAAVVESRPIADPRAQSIAAVLPNVDMPLLAAVVSLLVLGTVFVYSASMYQDYLNYGDVNYYMTKQIMWLALGSLVLFAGLRFDFQRLRKFSMIGLGITAVLLIMVHIPKISYTHGGATRWIYFKGFTLQPSEIGKLALTIYAAHWLSSKNDDVRHSLSALIPFGAVLGFTTLLIFRQPDLGTAAVISSAMLGMFFVSGARLRHLFALAALFLPVAYFVAHSGNYWKTRIDAYSHPFNDQQGTGYQISRALLAFWHGGLTGVGLGNGVMKETLPAANSDSIFATIGEETGLFGALVVVALFAFFAYRGIRISMLAKDPFGKLLAAGITSYLAFQALLNMLSVTNTIPFTGVPLPFISFGGSSLVVNLLAVGILLNVSRHIEHIPEERSDLTGTYLWWRNRRPHLPLSHDRQEPGRGQGSTWRERRLGGQR